MLARLQTLWWRELRYPVPPGCLPEEARDALERAIIYEFERRNYQAEPAGAHRFNLLPGFDPPRLYLVRPQVTSFQVEFSWDVGSVSLRYRLWEEFTWIRAVVATALLPLMMGLVAGLSAVGLLFVLGLLQSRYLERRSLRPALRAVSQRVFPQAPPI